MIDYKLFGEFTYEEKWRQLLAKAYGIAMDSKDPSTQNGAILVNEQGEILSWGANNLPEGIKNSPDRWVKPLKYRVVVHAEDRAILQACRKGLQVTGLTMVCGWACCTSCALSILESGVKVLVTHKQVIDRSPANWEEEILLAFSLLNEAKVKILFYDGPIGGVVIRHSGSEWRP